MPLSASVVAEKYRAERTNVVSDDRFPPRGKLFLARPLALSLLRIQFVRVTRSRVRFLSRAEKLVKPFLFLLLKSNLYIYTRTSAGKMIMAD